MLRVRSAFLAAVVVLVTLAQPGGSASTTSWQEPALRKIQELESSLGAKEQELLQVRTDLAAARAAEMRGGQRMVRRAAFDVGSAACKIVVADVDLHAGSVPNITNIVLSARIAVQLSDDLAQGGGSRFSERALEELGAVLREFKKRADEQGAEQCAGIATAAFRKASNGPAFLLQLQKEGIPLRIVSQEQEAFLGFLTANHLCLDVSARDLVAWDCGGGSFQITTHIPPGWDSWMKPLGTSVAKNVLLAKVPLTGALHLTRATTCLASHCRAALRITSGLMLSDARTPVVLCNPGLPRYKTNLPQRRRTQLRSRKPRRLRKSSRLSWVSPPRGSQKRSGRRGCTLQPLAGRRRSFVWPPSFWTAGRFRS